MRERGEEEKRERGKKLDWNKKQNYTKTTEMN